MRRILAVLITGLVLMTTGCAPAAPEGEQLYADGAQRYFPMAEFMHEVIMAVHEGTWEVPAGGYGAAPSSCQMSDGSFGYFLDYVRHLELGDRDPEQIMEAAEQAFTRLGLDPESQQLGTGEQAEWAVIAVGDPVGRAVVTIRPANDQIRVTARTPCTPGTSSQLTLYVFDDLDRHAVDRWRRLPATEEPNSVPQFYFPADGPLYYDENRIPVDPQPLVTDPPKAPYGD